MSITQALGHDRIYSDALIGRGWGVGDAGGGGRGLVSL